MTLRFYFYLKTGASHAIPFKFNQDVTGSFEVILYSGDCSRIQCALRKHTV